MSVCSLEFLCMWYRMVWIVDGVSVRWLVYGYGWFFIRTVDWLCLNVDDHVYWCICRLVIAFYMWN